MIAVYYIEASGRTGAQWRARWAGVPGQSPVLAITVPRIYALNPIQDTTRAAESWLRACGWSGVVEYVGHIEWPQSIYLFRVREGLATSQARPTQVTQGQKLAV